MQTHLLAEGVGFEPTCPDRANAFRVRCSIWNIVEVGILSTEPGGTFDRAENDLSKESKASKPTIYKAFRRFLIWRNFLQNEEKMERKTDQVQMRIDKK